MHRNHLMLPQIGVLYSIFNEIFKTLFCTKILSSEEFLCGKLVKERN